MSYNKTSDRPSVSPEADITYWKHRAEFFEKVLDAMSEKVLVKGPNSKLVWANHAFQNYYGMNNEQLRDLIDSPVNEPDYTQQYVQDDQWVWLNRKELKVACEPVTRFDGVVRKFETIKNPILSENSETLFSVGVSRDVTEMIDFTERTEASSKMAALGVMAGGIAHEINNPLAIVIGKAQLNLDLWQKVGPAASEKLQRNLGQILSAGERIMKIVSSLLNFSREGDAQFSRVKVTQVIEDTLSFCQSRIANREIELECMQVPQDLEVDCRPVNLSQILLNLLNNAFDAVQGSPAAWIKISAVRAGGVLELRVWDSGPGVPAAIEVKVMQPFFTTKEAGSGTGLGLSISSRLAKDHGGVLKLDRKTADSCFLLRIPLIQANKGGKDKV